ncbi:TlpA disulfide reductase family protein [Geobacter sp. DSM 9736]|uniref:TlpA family protein disulfide reductase n=1 Tax=Geobacter sp. DSM 9736 TaxID=1277350 RepID=UPI000B50AD23|nr:TlpA disulfide reductase family protein [Geobacter sp. DSM 9736]SNB45516.1 Peroxiredoxin [Geobacter sp. DSM 9736]
MRRPVPAIFALLLCGALFSGCAKEESWKIGAKAPEMSVLDLNDRTVKLSDYRGKPVVVRFWATGCQACVAAMPKLDELSKKYRDKGAAVLAVNMGNPKALVEVFAKGLKLSYPVFLDPALIAANKYRVKSVPTTFFIDRKGIAIKVVVGDVSKEVFEQTVSELL